MHRQTDKQKQTDHNNPLLSSSVNKYLFEGMLKALNERHKVFTIQFFVKCDINVKPLNVYIANGTKYTSSNRAVNREYRHHTDDMQYPSRPLGLLILVNNTSKINRNKIY